jgi:hypothetical protein
MFISRLSTVIHSNIKIYKTCTACFVCFARGSPLSLIYLCAPPPPPFVDAVTYENKFHYFHIVDLYVRIYLY